MPLNFPNNPSIGVPYTINGRRYIFDGAKWVGSGLPVGDVIPFSSVQALLTASESNLSTGYYEVAGQWVTYWDGTIFQPEPPINSQRFVRVPEISTLDYPVSVINFEATETFEFQAGSAITQAWP